MKRSLIFIGVCFLAIILTGIGVSQTNAYRNLTTEQLVQDSLKEVDTAVAAIDTSVFKLQAYDEEAIKQWQQQMAVAQMSPEQRAEYQRQYEMYMLQMQEQQRMIAQQKEYERRIREGGGVPPVSQKTQSTIEKLKREFEEKRKQDSIAKVNKGFEIK